MHLATRAFSATVAQAMAMAAYLPRRAVQTEAVRLIDAWFDTINSHSAYDAKPERCGYGITAASKERQDAALSGIDALIREARKVTARQPSGQAKFLPCQHGVVRSIAPLRGLHGELQTLCPEMKFLMTT